MLNYVTNRFEEFSSEMKQTANMPSINELIQSPVMSNKDLTSINKVTNEISSQTIASKQSVDIKKFEEKKKTKLENSSLFFNRLSSAFPEKTFRMRSSILTDLLEVSHIRSIRQIFISILVLLVLQVSMTDLFERGTYVREYYYLRKSSDFHLVLIFNSMLFDGISQIYQLVYVFGFVFSCPLVH